jgi:hypothetical protein
LIISEKLKPFPRTVVLAHGRNRLKCIEGTNMIMSDLDDVITPH